MWCLVVLGSLLSQANEIVRRAAVELCELQKARAERLGFASFPAGHGVDGNANLVRDLLGCESGPCALGPHVLPHNHLPTGLLWLTDTILPIFWLLSTKNW